MDFGNYRTCDSILSPVYGVVCNKPFFSKFQNFTYTVLPEAPCSTPDTETVQVTVVESPNSGVETSNLQVWENREHAGLWSR